MTLVILTEGIDLSLGAVLGLCGVAAALLVTAGYSLPLAVGAALVIGMAFGVLNGTLIAVAGMPPFVVTLGTFGIAQSIAMVLTKGDSVTNLPDLFPLVQRRRLRRNPGADLGNDRDLRRHLDSALPHQVRPLRFRDRRQPARTHPLGNARELSITSPFTSMPGCSRASRPSS